MRPRDLRDCPACGAEVEDAEVRFCGHCGYDVRAGTATDPSPTTVGSLDPLIGRVVDGRYRVQARIGQGGMGVVYRVEHIAMGKVAAMKMLHPSLSQEAEVVRRFRREAEAVSRLSHPNTVQVFDFGETVGSLYLVMELIRGEDLGALLRRDGAFPWQRLAPILSQVLDALGEAHELGVIHRDIKPENLIVSRTRDGRDLVKVLDFGLAKLRDVEELNSVTGRGTVIGTPYYMSPEQIRAEDLDARSDLYSLGALAYRAVTGEHPFAAATPVAVLTQHLTATLEPPRRRAPSLNIPSEAEDVIMRAMQRQPEDRYQTAEAMRIGVAGSITDPRRTEDQALADAARRASDASSHAVSAVGVAERLKREDFDSYERSLRLRRVLALLLLPLTLLLAGGGAYWFLLRDPAMQVRDEEREPNDDPATANLIVSNRTTRGQIGKRRSVEESDRDFYRLVVAPGDNRLNAEVSGIPDMDLILQVFDGAGRPVAESDSGAEGESEALYDLRVAPGEYYVQVREVWVVGQKATENVSDSYILKAVVDVAPPTEELEPNDSDEQANPVGSELAISGRLSHAADEDCFTASTTAAALFIGATVTGVPGVDLKLSVHARGELPGGKRSLTARMADSSGAGEGEKLMKQAWPADAGPPVVCLSRKDRRPSATHQHSPHVSLPGRAATYRLVLELGHP